MSDLSDLQAQVATMEQQIQELQQAAADNLSPNYLSINAQGQVIANLPGLVLPATTGPRAAALNSIQWQENADTVAEASAAYTQNAPPFGPHVSGLAISAITPDGGLTASAVLDLDAYSNGYASLTAVAGAMGATIIDSEGESNFILNATNTLAAVAFGSVNINFGGTDTGSVTVTHDLQRIPAVAFAGSIQGAIGDLISFSCGTLTATQMTITGYSQTPPGGPFLIGWVALG